MAFSLTPVPNDQILIQRLRGSTSDFEKTVSFLYRHYRGYLGKARKKYSSLSEEDLQDAYTDAINALIKQVIQDKYDKEKGSLSTLFYQIFSHKCVDQLRRITNHKNEWARQLDQLVPDLPVAGVNFLMTMVQKEAFEGMLELMEELKPPCKSLIMDLDYWGFTPEETAKRNGYKNGPSVSQAKYRCMESLRKKLSQKNANRSTQTDPRISKG